MMKQTRSGWTGSVRSEGVSGTAVAHVSLLTDETGQRVVNNIPIGQFKARHKLTFRELASPYDRSLWLYQHEPGLFKQAVRLRLAGHAEPSLVAS